VVIEYENQAPLLPQPLKDMLDKIMQACLFKTDEVIYLNHKPEPRSFSNISSNYQPEIILVFGDINLSHNLAPLIKNRPYEINGVKVLRTENLEKLDQMKAEKSALWTSLQSMFTLK
jgi:hypothetical protein